MIPGVSPYRASSALGVLDRPAPTTTNTADDVDHVVCCDNHDVALCGTDLGNVPWGVNRGEACVVCADFTATVRCPIDGHACEATR